MDDLILDVVGQDGDVEILNQAMQDGFGVVAIPPDVVPYEATPLAIALRNVQGEIEGGVIGHSAWDWLYVKLLWVAEAHRGNGQGKRLLDVAENVARDRACRGVWLNTHSFQAPDFYEGQGYRRFGVLEDFPEGHRRLFYQKRLTPKRE